tara:strand:+ start:1279 stop:1632 length:354 start_codon:yes stop_codon:yes gene_type:complete
MYKKNVDIIFFSYNLKTLMSNEQKKNDWQERELGALWAKKSNNGSQYMTGHIELKDASGKVQLVVFKNKSKYNEDGTVKNENSPDLRIYLSETKEEREKKPQASTASTSQDESGDLF